MMGESNRIVEVAPSDHLSFVRWLTTKREKISVKRTKRRAGNKARKNNKMIADREKEKRRRERQRGRGEGGDREGD